MTAQIEETANDPAESPVVTFGSAKLYQADALDWLRSQPHESIHGVVTDPPYGLVEYTQSHQQKLRSGKGGVWRIPPSFDGHKRSPLPRFTTLTDADLEHLKNFFRNLGEALLPVLVPGAHVMIASNPLVSHLVSNSLGLAGLEKRGKSFVWSRQCEVEIAPRMLTTNSLIFRLCHGQCGNHGFSSGSL